MNAPLQPVSMKKGRAHLPRLSAKYDPAAPRSAHYWSDAEMAILREYYPRRGGVAACELKLPHRTRSSIFGEAHKLGLSAHAQPAERRHIVLTPELERTIRDEWPSLVARGSVTGFAKRLGVPKHWLVKTATKLGLTTMQRKEPPWSEAEDELMRKVPLHDPGRSARIFRAHGFHRTPTAIVVRAKRMALSRRYRETLSAGGFARILGIDGKSVTGWCIAGKLKAGRRGTARLPQQGGDAWTITRGDARQFVIDQIGAIDIRKVDKIAFVDLLVSPAPGAAP